MSWWFNVVTILAYVSCVQVAWKYFYSTTSAADHGTMYQLRNLIGRSNVSADPVHKFNESDDFFRLIVTCYILVAAMELLQMKILEDVPSLSGVEKPQELWMETAEKRKSILSSLCGDIVDQYASFEFNKPPILSKDMVSLLINS